MHGGARRNAEVHKELIASVLDEEMLFGDLVFI
jgi:hypothetical protein